MKLLLLFSTLFLVNASYSQKDDNSLINEAINHFFDGLNAGDTSKICKAIDKQLFNLQSFIVINGKGEHRGDPTSEFLEIIAKPKTYAFEERILERTIHTDGFVASAWLPYECYINGKLSHTGVDIVQLAKFDGKWLMISIFDSRVMPKK